MKRFNINNSVRVRLTSWGQRVLRDRHASLPPEYAAPAAERFAADPDGWVSFQLWELMQYFGSSVGNGRPLCFEAVIEIADRDLA